MGLLFAVLGNHQNFFDVENFLNYITSVSFCRQLLLCSLKVTTLAIDPDVIASGNIWVSSLW